MRVPKYSIPLTEKLFLWNILLVIFKLAQTPCGSLSLSIWLASVHPSLVELGEVLKRDGLAAAASQNQPGHVRRTVTLEHGQTFGTSPNAVVIGYCDKIATAHHTNFDSKKKSTV